MRYRFLDCVLDDERRELRRAGELIPLRPRVYQLLTHLLEHRRRAVPKAELFERIWPKRVVSDATLNACVKELRKAVGDTGEAQRIIQTLHGHGFRFVAVLDQHEPAGALTDEAAASSREPTRAPTIGREYKHVSVLVCSVADAESLARTLGAEAMDELMRRFLDAARNIVERYGGLISEWTGAGFTALFGAPAALEDHGRRAAQAALEIFPMHAQLAGVTSTFALRMGLNAGPVVVGQLAADPQRLYTAVGDTTSLARRLHDRASPDALLASEASYRLVEAEAEASVDSQFEDGPAYRIRAIRVRRGGVPKRTSRSLSPLVGRDGELELLRQALHHAGDGRGSAVCIVGEPGIGKSRLIDEFSSWTASAAQPHRAEAHCLPYQTTTPYFPVISLMRDFCGIAETDTTEALVSKVTATLEEAQLTSSEARALLLELLHAPADVGVLAELGPEARRARLFGCLLQLILHRGRRELCLITIEDLHWIDATSQALIEQLLARIETSRLLLVMTCRPGYRPSWATSAVVTQIGLKRLTAEQSAQLIDAVPRVGPLPPGLAQEIIASARGNPFFIEELAWAARPEASPLHGFTVPSTVQAVIAARIDQLAPRDKHLLQIAAAIGARIDERLLRQVSEYEPSALAASLSNLEAREFLYEAAGADESEYTFRHALTHDVVYQSLLVGTRAHYHQCIAEVIEREFPEIASSQPEVLAQHWTAANRHERAFAYWRRAGIRASERSANLEAIEHLRRALQLNQRLASTPEAKAARLDVLLTLGPPLMATRGFAAVEVEENYAEARALGAEVGAPAQQFTAAWGLWLHNLHRGRIAIAKELVTEILRLAARIDDKACWLQAHHAGWTTELTHGDLADCRRHAEVGMQLYDRTQHHTQAYLYGIHDPGLCAHGTAAIADWFLGRPTQALQLARQTLELARQLTHPYSWLLALNDVMWMHCVRRDLPLARAAAREVIDVCTEQGVPNYRAFAGVFHGWAVAMSGELDFGIEEMQASLAAYRSLGLQRHCVHFLTLLAEGLLARGRSQDGRAALEEAERLLAATHELRWAPEIRRMRGRLLLTHPVVDRRAAEKCFVEALEQARAQGALSLELRAAADLAQLYLNSADRKSVREVLAPVVARFSDGPGAPELDAARALVAEAT